MLSKEGKPFTFEQFQGLMSDFIPGLPNGKIRTGKNIIDGSPMILGGESSLGSIQPETNTTLIEFAHTPQDATWKINEQSRLFCDHLKHFAHNSEIAVIGSGVVPTICWNDFKRYQAIMPHATFPYSWEHMNNNTRPEFCRTVFGTASVHHNLGFNDPEQMAVYMTTTLRLQPTMIALNGNAPFWNGARAFNAEGLPLLSYRSDLQLEYGKIYGTDGLRYLYPDALINPQANFAQIINYYLDAPLDRTMVEGVKRYVQGLTMREYINHGYSHNGKLHLPDIAAIDMMFRIPIMDVRPSMISAPRVETRAHDCVSHHMAVALDAFYRGIAQNLEEAKDLVSGIEYNEIRRQRKGVCVHGLGMPLIHSNPDIKTQQDLAIRALNIAETGLSMRGLQEEQFLAPLHVIAETGQNPAQSLLSALEAKSHKPSDYAFLLEALDYTQDRFADGTMYQWPSPETGNSSPRLYMRQQLTTPLAV
jgi:gamma-glutamylcysteine synthetase